MRRCDDRSRGLIEDQAVGPVALLTGALQVLLAGAQQELALVVEAEDEVPLGGVHVGGGAGGQLVQEQAVGCLLYTSDAADE